MLNKNEMPLVSIVIPVYNAEQYLPETLNSLVRQTYRNIEIICVDDGSTDSSVAMIQQYMQKDKRIVLLQQANLYAGIARNTGMAQAKGDYIIFLDSDDVFEKNMIRTLVKTMLKQKTDMVIFNYNTFSRSLLLKKRMKMAYKNVSLSNDEIRDNVFHITAGVPWTRFYSMRFVRETGLKFQGTINSNDIFFVHMTSVLCKNIYFLDKRFVNYRSNNAGSLQGSVNRNPVAFADALLAIVEELKKRGLMERYKEEAERYAIDLCMAAFERSKTPEVFKKVYEASRNIFDYLEITEAPEYTKERGIDEIVCAVISNDAQQAALALHFWWKDKCSKTTIEYRIGASLLRIMGIKR